MAPEICVSAALTARVTRRQRPGGIARPPAGFRRVLAPQVRAASEAGLPLIAVVAWDGTPRDGVDVTLAFRDEARRRTLEVVELSTC